MKNTIRITFSTNKEMVTKINEMKRDLKVSKSKSIKKALNFYYIYKDILADIEINKITTYIEMLHSGEHVILDIEPIAESLRFWWWNWGKVGYLRK